MDSTPLTEYCALNDIIYQTMALYTPQQNGVTERKIEPSRNLC